MQRVDHDSLISLALRWLETSTSHSLRRLLVSTPPPAYFPGLACVSATAHCNQFMENYVSTREPSPASALPLVTQDPLSSCSHHRCLLVSTYIPSFCTSASARPLLYNKSPPGTYDVSHANTRHHRPRPNSHKLPKQEFFISLLPLASCRYYSFIYPFKVSLQ
jgi:hypothetical protein